MSLTHSECTTTKTDLFIKEEDDFGFFCHKKLKFHSLNPNSIINFNLHNTGVADLLLPRSVCFVLCCIKFEMTL